MDNTESLVGALFGSFMFFVLIAALVVVIVGMWKIFEKAGQAGWKSLIPIYNTYILQVIAFGEAKGIFFLAYYVPFVNYVYPLYHLYQLAKAYGLSTGWAVANIFFSPIVLLYMGFSKNVEYKGPQEFIIK